MKRLIIVLVLMSASSSVLACDYEYTDSNGSDICANSGEREVTITTDNGDEHSGEWVGNGLVQDDDTGETTEIDQ